MTNKLTSEEKDFNKAMCTTCLLDWPMAQCLSCKFHIPEKEVEMNGWTPTVSKKVLDAIELATLEEMVKESPDNLYWQGRLEAKRQAIEIAADAEWLGSDGRNEIEHAQITATFGKVKVTTSAEWRKLHLHQTAAEVEAAKVQAGILKG